MESVILVIHLFLALGIIGLVLIQRSEGGGLGIGGGGGGMGDFASAQGTANALTRLTGIFAAGFFVTSLLLGILASHGKKQETGLLEAINSAAPAAIEKTIDQEETQVPSAPSNEQPAAPQAPLSTE